MRFLNVPTWRLSTERRKLYPPRERKKEEKTIRMKPPRKPKESERKGKKYDPQEERENLGKKRKKRDFSFSLFFSLIFYFAFSSLNSIDLPSRSGVCNGLYKRS